MATSAPMRSWDALPDAPLRPGALATAFLGRGDATYRLAGRRVHALPYGRNTDRSDWRLVLPEGRGTCSTKHALLAALAREQELPVRLTLGIYEMNDRNTPGVGPVLARHGLSGVPEAHCYLTFGESRVDVTRPDARTAEPIRDFLDEETIEPADIGVYKVARHREFLRAWLAAPGKAPGLDLESLWRVREACIAALADPDGAPATAG